jgi:CO/xanthine dehydrogenase Mo-binding subunit
MATTHASVDIYRAVHDVKYAQKLTSEQWKELLSSSEFALVMGEHPEWQESFVQQHRDTLARMGGLTNGRANREAAAQADTDVSGVGAREDYMVIGSRIPRVQGLGVVTGLGRYVENMGMNGMLFQATLRSPHPHAMVKSVDTSQAEALPGVVDIIHYYNLSEEENVRTSAGPPAQYIFDQEIKRVGAPVAAVVAESWHIADAATHLIEVEYEIVPAVLDMFEGMKAETPKQWDNDLDGTIISIQDPQILGDPDAGFSEADLVIETVTTRSTEQHLALEPSSSLIYWDDDRLIVYYTNQWSHGVRNTFAQRLGLPQSAIRVIQTGYMGSGYGFRSGIAEDEVHSAILARRTGRPIKRVATRSEDFVSRTHRPQFHNTVRLGVNRDGTMVALSANIIANVGAQRAGAASGTWFGYENLYAVPNIHLEATDVYTNSYLSGPYRCVSHPACTLALEVTVDEAANAIGMDPVEFRIKNFNLEGSPFSGNPYSNPGIVTTLEAVAEEIGWADKWHEPGANEIAPGVFHGIGIASHTCSHGGGLGGSGSVILGSDGSMNVLSASNEVGSGQRTLMAMIASETVGIPFDQVSITPHVDTDFTADTIGTFGSLQTNTGGSGVYEAGMDAKRQLLDLAVDLFANNFDLEVEPEDLDIRDGFVLVIDDPDSRLPVSAVVSSLGFGASIIGRGRHQTIPGFTRAAFASHAAEIEVDTVTGSIKVIKYVAAHDIGKALNPFALEQQIEGGVIMALGAALTEEMLLDQATGLPLTDNILEYKALTIKDVPRKIDVILVEHAREYGVFGAHGIGEPPMSPPGPTISNALFNALGVRIADMPYTRDKVLAALKSA